MDNFIFLSLFVKCMCHPEERCRLRLTAFPLLKSSKHCRSHSRPALEAMMSLLHLCSEMYKLFDARQELQNLPHVMVAHVPSHFKDIDHQDRTVIILSFTPGWCSQLNFASESIRSSVRGRPRRTFIGQWQYLECRAADCCFNVSIRHKILNLNEPLFKIPKTYSSSSLECYLSMEFWCELTRSLKITCVYSWVKE